jgi:addiction module HigA family antidote
MTDLSTTFSPDWISVPGDTILDLIEEKSWSQAEFAKRIAYTTKHVSQLINGKAPITEDTALKLEHVLGSSVRFWLNREVQYREVLARTTALKKLEAHVDWLKELPVNHMVKFAWVNKCTSKAQQVSECLSFFGVASVESWRNQYAGSLAAFRSSGAFEKKTGAVAAWLRQGERVATDIITQPFDKSVFKETLLELRKLTAEIDPAVFIPQLVDLCAKAGVAVVLEPAPAGCPVSGATRWMAKDKALLMLSLRHKTNDHLWFSLFHEAGHLLLHGKKMLFLEMKGLDGEQESEADKFARDFLIPPEHRERLTMLSHTKSDISNFAKELGIAPGIVVGRMQNEKVLPWATKLNALKVTYEWNHG